MVELRAEDVKEALEYAVVFDSRDNLGHVVGRATATSRALKTAAQAWANPDYEAALLKAERGTPLWLVERIVDAALGRGDEA